MILFLLQPGTSNEESTASALQGEQQLPSC